MPVGKSCLIDTNILLRYSQLRDPQHQLVQDAVHELNRQGAELCFTLQNATEFWNVCTRPADKNGYGLPTSEALRRMDSIERVMTFLPDTSTVYSLWRQLVTSHNVRGIQVHDAHLVATMQAHGIGHILTLNRGDFARFTEVQAIHPSEVPFETE